MNDKQQLAAMGAQYRLTEEQAKGLAERMPKTGALQVIDDEPLCMAKRVEELEAQVRVMAELLREAKPYMDHGNGAGVKGYIQISKKIDAALAGKMPAAPQSGGQMTFAEALVSAEEQYQQHRAAYVATLSPEQMEAIQRNAAKPRPTGRRITIERESTSVVRSSQCPYVGVTRLIKGAR